MASLPPSPPPHRPHRVAVIGGGISGLAAAHRLGELCREANRPLELVLFEAGPRLGGVIETRKVEPSLRECDPDSRSEPPTSEWEYLVETASDSFITTKPAAVDLCRRLGLEDRLIATDERYRRALVLHRGRPVEVPEGFMLLAPAKIVPVLASPIFSPWGKLRMGLEYFIPRRRGDGDESLASFVRRRFGREALERLVQPLVGGIYTSDPERLSLQATLPRFLEMERRHRSLIRAARNQAQANPAPPLAKGGSAAGDSGARYGLFATLAGGLSELIDRLGERIALFATIRLNTPVTALRPSDATSERGASVPRSFDARIDENFGGLTPPARRSQHHWQLTLHDATIAEFDAVILALPAYRTADLVARFDPAVADALRGIEYASTALVVTGHKLADVRHPLDAAGLVVPAIENRSVLAVSFASRKFPGRAPAGRVLLRTFIGGAMQPELFDKPDDELLPLVRRDLEEMLGVTGNPDFTLIARHPRAMPQYHVGHLNRVEEIERQTATHPSLALAGNAFRGVGLPDCIESGETAASRIFEAC